MIRPAAAALLLAALVAGCSGGSSATSAGVPAAAPAGCGTAAYPAPAADRPRYTLQLTIDPAAHRVQGTVAVAFTPDIATDRLVFRLWANGPVLRREGADMVAGPVTVDGATAASHLADPTTLVVPKTIAAGATVHASLRFRLTLPQRAKDRISQNGTAIRLGSFFPLLPWEPGAGWALQPPTLANGETSSSPIADFDATIHAPPGLGVVAGGVPAGPGRWVADDVRDFGVATGDFTYVRRTAHAPGPVRLTVAVPSGVAEQANQADDEAQAAIEHLSRLYGPYPWKTLTLAYGPDLNEEGIEYPTILFEGPDRFGLITAHEIAHQWFYSLVGNNQARDPWLDEGFASYAGAETSSDLPFFAKRRVPPPAAGHMGAPMSYWDHNQGAYFAGVYAQPVQVLQSFGSQTKVECALRRYVARNAYRIATDADAVAAFSTEFPNARAVFAHAGVP